MGYMMHFTDTFRKYPHHHYQIIIRSDYLSNKMLTNR